MTTIHHAVLRRWRACCLAMMLSLAMTERVSAQDLDVHSVTTDTIINLPIAKTWELFSTAAGWTSMGYTKVTLELRNGGRMSATTAAHASTPDTGIDAIITTHEPQRLLALQWQGNSGDWSLLYFQALGAEMTGLRWVEMSTLNETQPQARASAHRKLFDMLVKRYTIECHVCREEREAAEREQ